MNSIEACYSLFDLLSFHFITIGRDRSNSTVSGPAKGCQIIMIASILRALFLTLRSGVALIDTSKP